MTTATSAAELTALPPVSPVVRFGRLLASVWIKLRSMRSTRWSLIVLVVVSIGLTALFAVLVTKTWTGAHNASRNAQIIADPVSYLLGTGINLGQLAICVLGVLFITAEYSSGVIKMSLLVTPRRLPMLAAKAAVLAAVMLAVGEAVAFASFGLTQAVLAGHGDGVSLGHPGVPGAVLCTGLLLAVCVLLGLALGAIVRHTAGGIAATIAVIVIPGIVALLPSPWSGRIGRFTLLEAARQVSALHPATNLFSPAWSLLIVLAWPAVALAVAAVLITRRDA